MLSRIKDLVVNCNRHENLIIRSREILNYMITMPDKQYVIKIGKSYRFESAHSLPRLPVTHKCHQLHGHNYRIVITVSGILDDRGFIIDFAELDESVYPLLNQIDHKVLNDIDGLENPTAEKIALWIMDRVKKAETVRVYENEDCWAEVSRTL